VLRGKYDESLSREKRVQRAICARETMKKRLGETDATVAGIRPTCPIAMEIWAWAQSELYLPCIPELTLRKLMELFYPCCLSNVKQEQIVLANVVSAKWSASHVKCRHNRASSSDPFCGAAYISQRGRKPRTTNLKSLSKMYSYKILLFSQATQIFSVALVSWDVPKF